MVTGPDCGETKSISDEQRAFCRRWMHASNLLEKQCLVCYLSCVCKCSGLQALLDTLLHAQHYSMRAAGMHAKTRSVAPASHVSRREKANHFQDAVVRSCIFNDHTFSQNTTAQLTLEREHAIEGERARADEVDEQRSVAQLQNELLTEMVAAEQVQCSVGGVRGPLSVKANLGGQMMLHGGTRKYNTEIEASETYQSASCQSVISERCWASMKPKTHGLVPGETEPGLKSAHACLKRRHTRGRSIEEMEQNKALL